MAHTEHRPQPLILYPWEFFFKQHAHLCRWNERPRWRRQLVPEICLSLKTSVLRLTKKVQFFGVFLKQNKNMLRQKRQKRRAPTSGQVVHAESASHAQRCGNGEFQILSDKYTDLVCHWELGGWDTWDVWPKCPGPGDLHPMQVFRANTGSCVPFSIKAGVRGVGLVNNCIVVSSMIFSHFLLLIVLYYIWSHNKI